MDDIAEVPDRGPAGLPAQPKLSMSRALSLADQAAEAIVAGIAAGVLKPGQRLQEAELAATLQVSRVPLRQALKILESQGILASTLHRGAYVAAFDDLRIDRICEARIALERIALRDAALRYQAQPELLRRLDAIIETMEHAAARPDWMEVSQADLSFHREICRASGNSIVLTLWESLARHVRIVFGQEIRDERDAAVMGPQHRRLRDLLAAGDAASAMREIEPHILRLRRPRPQQASP